MSWKPLTVIVLAAVTAQTGAPRHVISGRVTSVAKGAALSICEREGESTGCGPVDLAADGSFVTRPLPDATYILVAGPSPFAAKPDPSIPHGLRAVKLAGRDEKGIVIVPSFATLAASASEVEVTDRGRAEVVVRVRE